MLMTHNTCDICTAPAENTMYTAGGHCLDLCAPCLDVLMEGRPIIDRWGFVFKRRGMVLEIRHVKVLKVQAEDYIKSVRAPIVRDPLRLETARELLHGSLADRDGSEI